MKTSPRVIPGHLDKINKRASDWGWASNLLAYGCQSTVVVLAPSTGHVVQVLERYRSPIVAVKWARQNYHHDLSNPYSLSLACADAQGRILIWDVVQGVVKAEFSDPSSANPPVTDLHWLASAQDASHDLLVALHPPYSVILWNADSGAIIWKKSYTDPLTRLAFDPFDSSSVTFLVPDGILFVSDFSINRCPPSNGQKYYISASNRPINGGGNTIERRRKETVLQSKMRSLIKGESEAIAGLEDVVLPNECLQLVYHRAVRHYLLLVYAREILIVDLGIKQTVGVIILDRGVASFVSIIPCRQSDAFFCLHDNGAISFRLRSQHDSTNAAEVTYETHCFSDALRLTRHLDVFGFDCSPVFENAVSLTLSDGRILIWELVSDSLDMEEKWPKLDLNRLVNSIQSDSEDSDVPRLQLLLTGLCPTLTSPLNPAGSANVQGVCILKMCPPLTTKNMESYQPLVAVGNRLGSVQVYNLSTGAQDFDFSLHTGPVKGIEWMTLRSFLSFCILTPSSYGLANAPASAAIVKNEVSVVEIGTGCVTSVKVTDEAPIETIRISHLKQYFIIVYKGRPFELWDLKTLTILRQMPKSCPAVAALEWSPSHAIKNSRKRTSGNETKPMEETPIDNASVTSLTESFANSAPTLWRMTGGEALDTFDETQLENKSSKTSLTTTTTTKEHFVFVDKRGLLYHFVVEGNVIKDGSKISPDGGLGNITSIAWKGETMVLGDVDGQLNIWDLKGRMSRAVPTHRGWIKKLRFAPGRGNMKLLILFADGAEVWDAKELQQCSSLKCPRDGAKILDVEWASSDKPIISTLDGCIRVTDLTMRNSTSPVEDSSLLGPIFVPHLLSARLSIFLKGFLENQLWRDSIDFSLDLMHLVCDPAKLGGKDREDLPCENKSSSLDALMDKGMLKTMQQQVDSLEDEVKCLLASDKLGTAQRCLLVASLFGDESAISFWMIATHFLKKRTEIESKKQINQNLPLCMDVLLENHIYKAYQLKRLHIQDSRASNYEQTSQCTENYIYLGLLDRAVQLLLETDPQSPHHYTDSLRACLVATTQKDGDSQSTVKLVATSMIAVGKISEGCQMLCLTGKGLDACRYLQTYGHWQDSLWLAKSTLSDIETMDVLKRYVDHLCSPNINLKSYAILMLLSMEHFSKALELMLSMRQYDRAACFAEALMEFGLWEFPDEQSPDVESKDVDVSLMQTAFLEYGRLLLTVGNIKGARHYALLAGPLAGSLLGDIETLQQAFLASKNEKNNSMSKET